MAENTPKRRERLVALIDSTTLSKTGNRRDLVMRLPLDVELRLVPEMDGQNNHEAYQRLAGGLWQRRPLLWVIDHPNPDEFEWSYTRTLGAPDRAPTLLVDVWDEGLTERNFNAMTSWLAHIGMEPAQATLGVNRTVH